MKIVIQGRPDELRTRGDDLKKVVERMADQLCKAPVDEQIDQKVRKLDYAALQGTVDRSQRNVDRARKNMLRRFAKVLEGS
jgi:hypothetical protein